MKTIPGFGKSGTSRTRSRRSSAAPELTAASLPFRQLAQLAPEEQLRELLRRVGERLQVFEARLAPLGIARAECRCDELLEQAGLAAGRVLEGAEMAGVDPELREPAAGGGDVGVALAVEPLAALDPR